VSQTDPENHRDFFAQFLDDYYAESDEHLTLVRRGLLLLENQLSEPGVPRTLLDELFRSFHTLKGISGMVGLAEAEQLSHHMESYLRLLQLGEVALSDAGLEVLIAGTTMLEKVIAARRNEESIPSIDAVITRLEAFETESPRGERSVEDEVIAAAVTGKAKEVDEPRHWRFVFTPSVALSEQGTNVNKVRARLIEVGEILRSTPMVENQREISFEFIVATTASPSIFEAWALGNLSYTPVAEEVRASQDSTDLAVTPETKEPAKASLPASATSMLASAGVVRVDLERLDDLMRMIGDLVSSRSRLEENLKNTRLRMPTDDWRRLQETSSAMAKQLHNLREGVIRVRLVQIGEIFERMRFVVRDLARESGKQIRLEISGEETEIDKFLVERMMDPLLHLVRNAVSHGLETPDERRAQSKPPEGRLTLSARTSGESILIEIADDGHGIDVEQVKVDAVAKGLIVPDVVFDSEALLEILCAPGFSTRLKADRESGRGVGMDVVSKAVTELGGRLSLSTEKNQGTRFMIELPLTLAIAEALIAIVGGQRFAIPQSAVREVIEVQPATVKVLENNEIIPYRDGVLPLVRLARLFELGEMRGGPFHVFVIGSGQNALGIAVDRIVGQREIVVRGIGDPLVQVPGIAGATELGDERVVLILDVAGVRRLAEA
jgi:two-component system chemotaxis sensor kinase CheA